MRARQGSMTGRLEATQKIDECCRLQAEAFDPGPVVLDASTDSSVPGGDEPLAGEHAVVSSAMGLCMHRVWGHMAGEEHVRHHESAGEQVGELG